MKGASIDEEPKSAARSGRFDDAKSFRSLKSLKSSKLGRTAAAVIKPLEDRMEKIELDAEDVKSQCEQWKSRHEAIWDHIARYQPEIL